MFEIIIDNQQNKIKVNEDLERIIKDVITTALEMENVKNSLEVSVVLTDNEHIKTINNLYRKVNTPTDVLSFAMRDSSEENFATLPESVELLGDIVISLEMAKEQAKDYGHSFEREVGFLVAHGIFHLLGYDHMVESERNIMRKREEDVLFSLKLFREGKKSI